MYRKRSEHALCNRRTTPDHRIFSGHMSTWSLRSIFGVCSSTEVSWISVLLTPCEHLYSWQCILSFTDVLIKISSTQLRFIQVLEILVLPPIGLVKSRSSLTQFSDPFSTGWSVGLKLGGNVLFMQIIGLKINVSLIHVLQIVSSNKHVNKTYLRWLRCYQGHELIQIIVTAQVHYRSHHRVNK